MSFGSEIVAAVKAVPAELVAFEQKATAEIQVIAKDVDAVMPTVKGLTSFVAQFVPGAQIAVTAETGLQVAVDGVDSLLTNHANGAATADTTVSGILALWTTLKADWAAVTAPKAA